MRKLFVWDFHGVLEKGNDAAVLEVTNEVLRKRGYERRMTEAEAFSLSGIKWHKYFAFLLPGTPIEQCIELEDACVDMVKTNPEILYRNIKPNDHAHEVLETIAAKHAQIVISNTSPTGIQKFLSATNMQHFFPVPFRFGIHTRDQNSETKLDALKRFLQDKTYDHIIAVGDSPHDMLGDINYLYAHPDRDFKPCEAHYKIRDLREVKREL